MMTYRRLQEKSGCGSVQTDGDGKNGRCLHSGVDENRLITRRKIRRSSLLRIPIQKRLLINEIVYERLVVIRARVLITILSISLALQSK